MGCLARYGQIADLLKLMLLIRLKFDLLIKLTAYAIVRILSKHTIIISCAAKKRNMKFSVGFPSNAQVTCWLYCLEELMNSKHTFI